MEGGPSIWGTPPTFPSDLFPARETDIGGNEGKNKRISVSEAFSCEMAR